MKTTARNKFDGTLVKVEPLGIIVNLELAAKDGIVIKSQITEESRISLDLRDGKRCSALVKAPFVRVAPAGACGKKMENCLEGVIEDIKTNAYATEITGRVGKEHRVCAVYSNGETAPDGLKKGDQVRFCFAASSVIITD